MERNSKAFQRLASSGEEKLKASAYNNDIDLSPYVELTKSREWVSYQDMKVSFY